LTQPERSDCARTSIVDWWRWREPSTRRKLLAPIREDLERLIGTDWRLWRHPAQTPPDGAWSSWLFLGGRGAGKTRAGAEWLAGRARPGARLALVGPTLHDVREVMIEGPSGLRSVAAPWRRPIYEAGRRRLIWPNGATAHAFSAEDADSLRGPQFHAAWCDEFCAWRRPGEVLAMLRMGLRLGDDPRLMITTTPRPITALKTLMAEPGTATTRAATAVNRRNLSANFLRGLDALYGGTRLAQQELEGHVLSDEGALWTESMVNACQGRAPERFERVVVGLDPPATADGDACGIVVVGRFEGRAYVLADRSVRGLRPQAWARLTAEVVAEFEADWVIAEVNQGGQMVEDLLRIAHCGARVKPVFASRSKRVRAEPVAALYEQDRVIHCAPMRALEAELLRLGGEGEHSPDRADALVWAVSHLLLGPKGEPRLRPL